MTSTSPKLLADETLAQIRERNDAAHNVWEAHDHATNLGIDLPDPADSYGRDAHCDRAALLDHIDTLTSQLAVERAAKEQATAEAAVLLEPCIKNEQIIVDALAWLCGRNPNIAKAAEILSSATPGPFENKAPLAAALQSRLELAEKNARTPATLEECAFAGCHWQPEHTYDCGLRDCPIRTTGSTNHG